MDPSENVSKIYIYRNTFTFEKVEYNIKMHVA